MEKIILVNVDNQIIGSDTKSNVHKKGLLHRAFSVFIVNEDKMLIQKRNRNKYHSGGLWTNTCCSHQREGEDLQEAVHRRLMEEMGIKCTLKELFHFQYRTKFSEDLYEYEIDHVFVGEYHGSFERNEEEAEEAEWITFQELKERLLNAPEIFTSWFLIAAPAVMHSLEKKE